MREVPLLFKVLQQREMPAGTDALPTHLCTIKKRGAGTSLEGPEASMALQLRAVKGSSQLITHMGPEHQEHPMSE